MDDFLNKFELHWKTNKFPNKNEKILVAISGGKDSMALAVALYTQGYSIALAHCNYQLREEASHLDEQLVKDWAAVHKILIHSIKFDTQNKMTELKMSLQETARTLRYTWFQSLCKANNYAAVATAHHANDNAETLLINLCKGTGIAGLHGILVKNNNIIRPFLFANRQEIEHFVTTNKIPFREDESNASTKYLRNAVRHNVIPTLNELFPNVVDRIKETTQRIKLVETIYNETITQEKKKLIEKRGLDDYIPILKLKKRPGFEAICFEIFTDYNFTAAQLPEIIKLLDSQSGQYIKSSTHKIIKNRNFLIITQHTTHNTDLIIVDNTNQNIETNEGTFSISLIEKNISPSNNENVAFIDLDLISFPIILRRWKTADYFYPLGMGMKKKKLSRYFIDKKIPIHEKEKIWLIENDKKIVWVAGMRQDERFKISTKTKKILQIIFSPK